MSAAKETDLLDGNVRLVIEDDFGKRKDRANGLVSGTVARETWKIHPDDPRSARGRCHWTTEMGRGDWQLRTDMRCEMWPDAAHFHLTALLEAYEGDALIYDRDLTDSIPRNGL